MIRNAPWLLWVTLICWAGRHINWDSTRDESHQEVTRSLENGRKQVSEEPNGILTWNLTGRWDPKGHESLSLQFEIRSFSSTPTVWKSSIISLPTSMGLVSFACVCLCLTLVSLSHTLENCLHSSIHQQISVECLPQARHCARYTCKLALGQLFVSWVHLLSGKTSRQPCLPL